MALHDVVTLFATRCLRMFAYGAVAVILLLRLTSIFNETEVALLLSLIFAGDIVISLFLTTHADRWSRKLVLVIGALLKVCAGLGFQSHNFWIVMISGTVGVITPTAGEIGPFSSIEQAALADMMAKHTGGVVEIASLSTLLAWYQALGGLSVAAGALSCGFLVKGLEDAGHTEDEAWNMIFLMYSVIGGFLVLLFLFLSPDIECQPKTKAQHADIAAARTVAAEKKSWFGSLLSKCGLESAQSQQIIGPLSLLFAMDAFAGGLVVQTFFAWWFQVTYSMQPDQLGEILMGVNVLGGLSGLAAGWFVQKIGPINTMVFTHLPSNILLMLVPLMPSAGTAFAMLLARFSISQMDVPARQAYVGLVVPSYERSAANGVTSTARSVGVTLSPFILKFCIASTNKYGRMVPFLLSGLIKCLYDVIVYYNFTWSVQHASSTLPTTTVVPPVSATTTGHERTPLLQTSK